MQRLDDAEGDGERVVVKSPGGSIRVEVSSSTGDVSVFNDGSPEPLVGVSPLSVTDESIPLCEYGPCSFVKP